MRSFVLLSVVVFLSSLLVGWLFPWWTVVIVGFAAAWISRMPACHTFLAVLIGVSALWLGAAVWFATTTSTDLPVRMAELLRLPAPWLLYPATALIGALPAALTALGGSYLRRRKSAEDQGHLAKTFCGKL